MATEVALAAAMLVGAGLVGRGFQKLMAVDPGFTTEGALVMDVSLRCAWRSARPGEVSRLVIGSGLRLVRAGVVVGLVGAAASGRVLSALL